MKSLTRSRNRVRAAFVLAGLAILLALPSDVAAVTSGGWSNLGHGATSTTPPIDGKVETLFSVGSKLYVGGDFDNAGGLAGGDLIATWDGTKWGALGAGLGGLGRAVYAIAVDSTTGLVFAGGSFDLSGSVPAGPTVIGEFNGTNWISLPGLSPLDGPVFSLMVMGRYLYIAGGFAHHNGGTPANSLIRWNIDTHVQESITPAVDTISGTPAAMVPDGSGGLYLGGGFINADGAPGLADFVAHWTAPTTWTALGSAPLNARVRSLAIEGSNLYVGGDFTGAGGVSGADHVALWNGSSWSRLGASSFFSTAGMSVYGLAVDHGTVVASGYFNNAGGLAKADGIAVYSSGTWSNVGTSADGTNGPVSLNTTEFTVRIVGSRLYLGGLDSSIADNNMCGFIASYRFHQPDGLIRFGTGTFVGNNVYNTTAKNQTKAATVHRNQSGTFSIQIANDGLAADSFTVKGAGSSGAFTVTYLDGVTNVTAQVVAGTYAINNLAVGASKTLTLQVAVGAGAVVGSSKSFLVTATSTGGGAAKDAVKATVNAS